MVYELLYWGGRLLIVFVYDYMIIVSEYKYSAL